MRVLALLALLVADVQAYPNAGPGDALTAAYRKELSALAPDEAPHAPIYIGCFKNHGNCRMTGHVSPKSVGECVATAKGENRYFFGMEWPQGYDAKGKAQCLTISVPKIVSQNCTQVNDSECTKEIDAAGNRLGNGHRLAVYMLAVDFRMAATATPTPAPMTCPICETCAPTAAPTPCPTVAPTSAPLYVNGDPNDVHIDPHLNDGLP